jgi:hypothetical protein
LGVDSDLRGGRRQQGDGEQQREHGGRCRVRNNRLVCPANAAENTSHSVRNQVKGWPVELKPAAGFARVWLLELEPATASILVSRRKPRLIQFSSII